MFVSRDTHNSRQSIVIPVCLSAVIHIKLPVKSYIITFVSRDSHRICELIAIHVINRLCLLALNVKVLLSYSNVLASCVTR